MSSRFPELQAAQITIDPLTRDQHMAGIAVALREHRIPRVRRLRLFALAAVLILLLPVLALAAENAVPGDFLYPVKRLVEPVVAVVDRDVEARHRVTEVERLADRGAPHDVIVDHAEEARAVVTDRHPDLAGRIDKVTEEVARLHDRDHRDDAVVGGGEDSRSDDKSRGEASERTTTTIEPETTTSEPATDSTRPRDGRDG